MSTLGLGIFLGALGSVSINTGNNLQSLGMAQLEIKANEEAAEEEMEAVKNDASKNVILDEEIITPPEEIDSCQSPVWVIGTVIFVTGSLLNFAAFAFAPQSILASLEGIQFVTNVAFGRLVLGSHITNMMYFGTFITIVGVVLTVLSASVVGTLEATVNDLLVLWTNPLWLLYLLMCCGAGVALHVTHVAYEKAALAGKPYPNSDYVLPITYATFSALFGTFSVVLAKILSELLTLQLEFGVPIFYGADAWFTYVTLIAWITFAGIWLYRMNEALGLYDPLFIIPLLQVNFILFAIISGGIYFKEFSYFGPVNVIGFCLGVILLILGIFLLSPPIAIDTEDPLDKITLPSDVSFASIGPVGPTPPPATDGAARRISFTRRSISIRDLEGNVKSPVANKRGTLSHFKFGAVASMNDVQHDHNVNRAIRDRIHSQFEVAGYSLEDVVDERGEHHMGWVNHSMDGHCTNPHSNERLLAMRKYHSSHDDTSDITEGSVDGVMMYGDAAVGESLPKNQSSQAAVRNATARGGLEEGNQPKKSPLVTFDENDERSRTRSASLSLTNIFDVFNFTEKNGGTEEQSNSWNLFSSNGRSSTALGSFYGYMFGSANTPSPSLAGSTHEVNEETKIEMAPNLVFKSQTSMDRPPPASPDEVRKDKEFYLKYGNRIGTSLDDTTISTINTPVQSNCAVSPNSEITQKSFQRSEKL